MNRKRIKRVVNLKYRNHKSNNKEIQEENEKLKRESEEFEKEKERLKREREEFEIFTNNEGL